MTGAPSMRTLPRYADALGWRAVVLVLGGNTTANCNGLHPLRSSDLTSLTRRSAAAVVLRISTRQHTFSIPGHRRTR
jgi:hypothetical protein